MLKATGNDSNKTSNLAAKLIMLELIIFDLGYYNAKALRILMKKEPSSLAELRPTQNFMKKILRR